MSLDFRGEGTQSLTVTNVQLIYTLNICIQLYSWYSLMPWRKIKSPRHQFLSFSVPLRFVCQRPDGFCVAGQMERAWCCGTWYDCCIFLDSYTNRWPDPTFLLEESRKGRIWAFKSDTWASVLKNKNRRCMSASKAMITLSRAHVFWEEEKLQFVKPTAIQGFYKRYFIPHLNSWICKIGLDLLQYFYHYILPGGYLMKSFWLFLFQHLLYQREIANKIPN